MVNGFARRAYPFAGIVSLWYPTVFALTTVGSAARAGGAKNRNAQARRGRARIHPRHGGFPGFAIEKISLAFGAGLS